MLVYVISFFLIDSNNSRMQSFLYNPYILKFFTTFGNVKQKKLLAWLYLSYQSKLRKLPRRAIFSNCQRFCKAKERDETQPLVS